MLVTAGAKPSGDGPDVQLTTLTDNTVQSAITRSVPLIQAGDAGFTPKSACICWPNDSRAQPREQVSILIIAAAHCPRRFGLLPDEGYPADPAKNQFTSEMNVWDFLLQ